MKQHDAFPEKPARLRPSSLNPKAEAKRQHALRSGAFDAPSPIASLQALIAEGYRLLAGLWSPGVTPLWPRLVFAGANQDLGKTSQVCLQLEMEAKRFDARCEIPLLYLEVDTAEHNNSAIPLQVILALDKAFPDAGYAQLLIPKMRSEQHFKLAALLIRRHRVGVLVVEQRHRGSLGRAERHSPKSFAQMVFAALGGLNVSVVVSGRPVGFDFRAIDNFGATALYSNACGI
jgi:hypothetical protein